MALTARFRVTVLFCLALLLVLLGGFPATARAADNLFNSGAVIRDELSRVGSEGKLFLTAPADPYLAQSAAVVGAFALSYVFDRDIRSDLAGTHSMALKRATDAGSFVGNPYLHIGVAAALYGTGAAADAPRLMLIGEELGEALLISDAATVVLKQAIGRGRPATGEGNSRYKPFEFATDYDSLPSMHTASSFAIAHVLASQTESLPVKIFCYAAASFVGFSRLYQERHWASDVVVAAAIGELAGNSVTRYRASQPGALTVAPLVSDGVAGLALLGKF